MKQVVLYLFLFISTTLLFSCKKYPEGGCERRGPKNIIGSWKLSLYEVNGIDSTDLINYNNRDEYKKITFLKNVSTFSIRSSGFAYSGRFENKNANIKIYNSGQSVECVYSSTLHDTLCYRNIFSPEKMDCIWQIVKLTQKELVIKTEQQNSYVIKLTK